MEMNKKMLEMLGLLLEAGGRLPSADAVRLLQGSKRAFYYNVEKLNQWLSSNRFENARIEGETLVLDQRELPRLRAAVETMDGEEYSFSKEERKAFSLLYIALSPKPVTIEFLRGAFDVSRNTVVGELSELRRELTPQNVLIQSAGRTGYAIGGDEQAARYTVMDMLFSCLSSGVQVSALDLLLTAAEHWAGRTVAREDIPRLQELVRGSETLMSAKLGGTSLYEIVLYLLVVFVRDKKGSPCALPPEGLPQGELAAARWLLGELETQWGIALDPREETYLAAVLLGSKAFDLSEPLAPKARDYRFTKELLDAFEAKVCVRFANKDALIRRLLIHTRPMLYRCQYRIKVRNMSTREIKLKYRDIYLMTELVVRTVAPKYQVELEEDEVAFLSMYLGGFLIQEFPEGESTRRVLIVCGFGHGTSLLVKQQVMPILGDQYRYVTKDERQFTREDLDRYDLVISTVDTIKSSKLLRVSPMLTSHQRQQVMEWGLRNADAPQRRIEPRQVVSIVKQYAKVEDEAALMNGLIAYLAGQPAPPAKPAPLCQALQPWQVSIQQSCESYERAIRMACQPLMDRGVIHGGYAESVLGIMEELGLYFELRNGILLAHAKPGEPSAAVGFSLTLFRVPVDFWKWGKRIGAIFMLATVDNSAHLPILKALFRLMQKDENCSRLRTCDFRDEAEAFEFIRSEMGEEHDQ